MYIVEYVQKNNLEDQIWYRIWLKKRPQSGLWVNFDFVGLKIECDFWFSISDFISGKILKSILKKFSKKENFSV